MLGAALAMLWRPGALMRGPMRNKSRVLDALAVLGMAGLGVLIFTLSISRSGDELGTRYNPWLFRGGIFLTGVTTLCVIAAVVHRRSFVGRILGNPVLNWIGTRSYGLYLYHWPIYQIIRKFAGVPLTLSQFFIAMAFTVPITEISYRAIETPIRLGRLGRWLRGEQRIRSGTAQRTRRRAMVMVASLSAAVGFAGVSLAVARNVCVGDVECSIQAAEDAAAASAGAPGPVAVPSPSTRVAPRSSTTPTDDTATHESSGDTDDNADSTSGSETTTDGTTASGGGSSEDAVESTTPTASSTPDTAPAGSGVTTTVLIAGPVSVETTTPTTAASTTAAPTPSTAAATDPAAPAETTPPTPATIPGTPGIQPIALGESVMLGAVTNLQAGGFFVDALKGRQGSDMAALVETMRANNQLGEIVVIQIGTNGSVSWEDLQRIMAQLPSDKTPKVVFLTVRVPKRWQDANNLMIHALPDHYDNVTVLDWQFASMGTNLCSDGTHIACGGGAAQYYTNLIFDAIGRPDLKR
jgi:hypothetical protein